MAKISGTQSSDNTLNKYTPSVMEYAIIGTSGTLLFVILNVPNIIERFKEIGFIVPRSVSIKDAALSPLNQITLHIFGQSGSALLATLLFWSVVGLVLYLFVRILREGFVDFQVALSEQGYVYPSRRAKNMALTKHIMEGLLRITAILALFIYIPLFITVILPLVMILFSNPVINLSVGFLKDLIAGALILFLGMHSITLLLRFIFQRARLFG